MLEVWGPRFVQPWCNVFAGAVAPQVVLPDAAGEHRAPADVVVNGRAEFRRGGHSPVLQGGDVLFNPLGEAAYRVPLERVPVWKLERSPAIGREEALGLLERQAALAGVDLGSPDARQLLGASRAWRLGSLRGEWHRGFLVEARWSAAGTVRASMAWHLWQVLASPAGVGLERFVGTPVDAADVEATLVVVEGFPAPRLREVVFETVARIEGRAVAGVDVRRVPLPWLVVETSGPWPEGVFLEGPTNQPRLKWRQLVELQVNGQTPGDRCLWHDGLWLELRAGDRVEWSGGHAMVRSSP